MSNSWSIFTMQELKRAFRFYRLGPIANQQARSLCREILGELRRRRSGFS